MITFYPLRNNKLSIFLIAAISFFFCIQHAAAATRYAVSNKNWSQLAAWSATDGGPGGASVPGASDDVIINGGNTITLDVNVTCNSLTFGLGANSTTSQLTIGAFTLIVSGNVTLVSASSSKNTKILLNSNSSVLNIGGNLALGNAGGGNASIDLSGSGFNFNTTLKIAGSMAIGTDGTFTPGGASIVDFDGTANTQTIDVTHFTYANINIDNTYTGGATLGAAITTSNMSQSISVGSVNSGSLFNTGNFAIAFVNGRGLTLASGSAINAGTTVFNFGSGATVILNGTFQTANTNGFYNSSGTAAISNNNNPSTTLGSGSTIEYNASGTQTATLLSSFGNILSNYANVTLTGGSKTMPAGTISILGTLLINSGATYNGTTNNPTLNIGVNLTDNGGTFTQGTNAVNFNGSVAQAIGGTSPSITFAGPVYINNTSATVSVNTNVSANSLTINQAGSVSSLTLSVSSAQTFAVTGPVTMDNSGGGNATGTITGAGTLTCASVTVGGTTTLSANSIQTTTLTSTIAAFTISGNLSLVGLYPNPALNSQSNNPVFDLESGTVTVGGNIATTNNGLGSSFNTSTVTMALGAQKGTLILTGPTPFSGLSGSGTNTITFTGTVATVNYAGTAQPVLAKSYTNLTFSGSGKKTIASVTNPVNGILAITGMAIASISGPNTNVLNVGGLWLNGTVEPLSTSWGSITSTATNQTNTYFDGVTNPTGKVLIGAVTRTNVSFSSLTASQNICTGSASSVTLTGVVSNGGSTFPASGEGVSATINDINQASTIGSSGVFSIIFPISTIPASGSPYTITYNYSGNATLNPASNTSTTLSINPTSVGGTASPGTPPYCSGYTTTVSVTGNTGTVQWQQSATGTGGWSNISGATLATYTTPALSSTIYYQIVVTDGACPSTTSTVATVTVTNSGLWNGTSSTNWNDGGNWCPGVPPTSTTDVIIPSGTPHPPTISTVAACHNLTINNGAILTVSTGGDLSLYGSPTIGGTYTQTAGTLELVGSSNQSIPAIGVNNLIINNASGGAVTLSGNLTVNGTLTLTKGVVTTGADTVIVTNSTNTSVVSGSGNTSYVNSWVNGYIKRSFAVSSASYDFPVGTSSKGCLATVNSNLLTGISYFTAIFVGPLVQTGNNINSRLNAWETSISGLYETPYTSINTAGTWKIDPDAQPTGSTTYDISLYFNGFTGMADNQFGILKRASAGTPATDYAYFKPGGGTINTTGGSGRTLAGAFALRKGLSSFSEFAIGQSGAVLPIQLVAFTAEKCDDDKDALLKWNTASEENNDHFDVEAATGTNASGDLVFSNIGEVKGNGTSAIAHNYSFVDATTNKYGTRYYRLGQVDLNGGLTYSEIIALNFDANLLQVILLYPNPVTENISLKINSPTTNTISYCVSDILGQILQKGSQDLSTGNNQFNLPSNQLGNGIYFLTVKDEINGTINIVRFVKSE